MIRFALTLLMTYYGFTTASANENACNNLIHLPDYFAPQSGFSAVSEFFLYSYPDSVIIPIKRAGNLILLEAIVDSMPGNLILDTGSAALVLNSIYFGDPGRQVAILAGGITGSTGATYRSRVKNMQISSLAFSGIDANITDLGHIEKARNIRVLGFFGLGIFSGYEVVLDLQNGVLELHRQNFRGNRVIADKKTPAFDLNLPIRTESSLIFFDAMINKRKLTFCLDTGAESNVLSSQLSDNVLKTVDIFRRSTLRGAGTQNVEVLYGQMNDLSIGKTFVGGMSTIITNLNAMSNYFGVRIDGMLGCEFLEKGVFYINMKQQKLGIIFYKESEND
jgi:hypothetical protein